MNAFTTIGSGAAVVAMVVLLAPGSRGSAVEDTAQTAAPRPAPEPAASPAPLASLAPLAFMAGTWQGSMNGGFVEETWSEPQGTSIVGFFRWLKPDGSAMMFELLTITAEGDDVRLRLRHFSPTLDAKEPADKPQTLILAEQEPGRALFRAEKDAGALDHISYVVEDGVLRIEVAFVESDPPRRPLRFELRRKPPERVW